MILTRRRVRLGLAGTKTLGSFYRAEGLPSVPIGTLEKMPNPPTPPNPVVGQLTPNPSYPKPVQPGGAGNIVTDPRQPEIVYTNPPYTPATNPTPYNERAAYFFGGCSHCIRSWEIKQTTLNGAPAKLVCCPLCGWVQSIHQPPDSIMNVNETPIIYG